MWVVGLVGGASVLGEWDINPGELRCYARELADELIKSQYARLAKPSELPDRE